MSADVRMVKSDQNPTPRMDMAVWGKRVNRATEGRDYMAIMLFTKWR